MGQSSSPAASSAPEVVVVGRTPRLTAVAEYLHSQCDFRVAQLTDATQFTSFAAPKIAVLIANAAASSPQLERLFDEAAWPVLVLGTSSEVHATWSRVQQVLRGVAQRALELPREYPVRTVNYDHFMDFVCTRHSANPLDSEELSETALRVRRLVEIARASCTQADQGIHDPESGRVDANRIANFLGIPLRTLAQALGRNYASLHKTPDAPSAQQALGPFARTIELLRKLHPSALAAREWLNTPHRELDERAPLQVMLDGGADVVRDMLEAAYLGLPT